jgi:uncharacterized protein (DUF2062 family)
MPSFPRLRSWLEQLLHTHDTPHRTAGAYALGVFLAFSPMLGLHAVLGLALAFVFRLNRVAVILGVYTNLPWVVPAYYTLATIAGAAILGVDVQPRALEEGIRAISSTPWGQYSTLARSLAPLIWAFVLGSTIGAVVLAAVAYRVSLVMILAHRKRISQRSGEIG